MDQENLNTSFDGLFEDNAGRDWIVTKHEKGKVKVARCTEEELDELYKTRTDWMVKKIEVEERPHRDVPNWQLYGAAMFFLRDMLNCETKDGYFICKNIPFIGVNICGTVVKLSTTSDKYVIVVDDGTSSVACVIKHDQLAAMQLSEEVKQRHIALTEALKANPDDPILRGKAIMMNALKNLVKNIPTFEDLKLGDVVTILGNLSEYKNNRYVFIKSIEKEPEDSIYHIKYLEELLDLYINQYEDP